MSMNEERSLAGTSTSTPKHRGLETLPLSVEFARKYSVAEVLGEGGYSRVRRCLIRGTLQEFAVKCCSKVGVSPAALRNVHYEIALLQRLHHRHILRLHEAFNGRTTVYLVLEYLPGGSLHALLARPFCYPERMAAALLRNLLSALHYLHHIGVAHCDLKAENVLFKYRLPSSTTELMQNPQLLTAVKLADFGFARVVGERPSLTACHGTAHYVAPEVLRCGLFRDGPPYGSTADLWSLGVLGYLALTGRPPFLSRSRDGLFRRIVSGAWAFPEDACFSEGCRDFFRHLLVVDPAVRLTASSALRHRWISQDELRRPASNPLLTHGRDLNRKASLSHPHRPDPLLATEIGGDRPSITAGSSSSSSSHSLTSPSGSWKYSAEADLTRASTATHESKSESLGPSVPAESTEELTSAQLH